MCIRYFLYLIFFLHLALVPTELSGQDVMIVHRTNLSPYLYRFNTQTCSFDTLCKCRIPAVAYYPGDITFTPDGKLYSNTEVWAYYFQEMSFDPQGAYPDTCKMRFVSQAPNIWGDGRNCVVSDEKGDLYSMSYYLYKYYPKKDIWESKGRIPNFYNEQALHHLPVDWTLTRRGKDYYYIASSQTYGSPVDSLKFIKLNINDPAKSEVIFPFRNNIWIRTMFTVRESCDQFTTYIIYLEFDDYNLGYGNMPNKHVLATLDIKSGIITDVCDVTIPRNFGSLGAAVPWTQMDSDCLLILDLDSDDSSGAQKPNDYFTPHSCEPDNIPITDVDPDVFAYNQIDSIQIRFAEAPPDGGNEFFESGSVPGVTITGSGTQQMTLVSYDPPAYEMLKEALTGIRYRNLSGHPTGGNRKVAFVGYTSTIVSDTAYSYIHLPADLKGAGSDNILELCANDAPVALNEVLSADASQNGYWSDGLNQSGMFDPGKDVAGIYRYIVPVQGCEPDTASITIIVHTLPDPDLGRDTMICTGSTLILSGSGSDVSGYLWQDGSMESTLEVQESGMYTLQITDSNGCVNSDTIQVGHWPVQETPTVVDTMLCFGEIIQWKGHTVNVEGAYEFFTEDKNGCDSTVILNVSYLPHNSSTRDTLICKGDTLHWNDQQIFSAGNFSFNSLDIEGCDSTAILNVGLYPIMTTGLKGDTYFCKGEYAVLEAGDHAVYEWSTGETGKKISVKETGWYSVRVKDEFGCHHVDSMYVEEDPSVNPALRFIPESCYNEKDGAVRVDSISGGTGRIQAYIEGKAFDLKQGVDQLSPGIYMLSFVDSLDCETVLEGEIDSAVYRWCDLGEDLVVPDKGELEILLGHNVDDISSIQWYVDGQRNESTETVLRFRPSGESEVIVIVTDGHGCEVSDTLRVIVDRELDLYMPNIFSPNGDGLNDALVIKGSDQIRMINSVRIYDRWGGKIHESHNIQFWTDGTVVWDGNYRGNVVNPGIYVYVIEVGLLSGQSVIRYGDVMVVR